MIGIRGSVFETMVMLMHFLLDSSFHSKKKGSSSEFVTMINLTKLSLRFIMSTESFNKQLESSKKSDMSAILATMIQPFERSDKEHKGRKRKRRGFHDHTIRENKSIHLPIEYNLHNSDPDREFYKSSIGL